MLKVLAPPPLPVWLFAICFLFCFVVFLISVMWLFCFVVNVSVESLFPPPHVSLFPSCVVVVVSLFVFIAFFFFWISSFLDLVCGGRFM